MSDPFADLDQPEASAAPVPQGQDPFADLDGPPQSTVGTMASAPFVGFNRALAETAGAPVDFVNWLGNKAGLPVSQTPFLGSGWIEKNLLGSIGANPEEHAPRSETEKILQSAGAGVGSMLVPEAGLETAARAGLAEAAPKVTEALRGAFGSAASVPEALGSAATGAAAGAGGQTAQDVTGHFAPNNPYAQYAAGLTGTLLGGAAGAGAVAGAGRLGSMVSDFGTRLVQPLTESGRQQLAAQRLVNASETGRYPLLESIENEPGQIVPGSQPTLFQQTGDMGIGGLERQVSRESPENAMAFLNQRAVQNEARLNALGNVQPTGSAAAVTQALRQRLNQLEAEGEAQETDARTAAIEAASGLGGTQTPEFYGAQIQGQVMPRLQAATQQAAQAVQGLGGEGTPEAYGLAMQTPLAAAKESARQQRNSLYNAIDPDNSLNIVAAPVRQQVKDLYGQLSNLAQPPAGEEASIAGVAASLPDVIKFNDLRALESRVTAAMGAERRANGETPVWGRLSQVKNAVSGAIDNGVQNQIDFERQQVENGALAPENTVEARAEQYLQNAVSNFYANRSSRVASAGEGTFGSAGAGPSGPVGVSGTAGKTGFKSGNPPGDQSVPEETLQPNFDEAAADRLNAAKAQHALYAQTYRQGPLAQILKTNGFRDQFVTPDSAVPDKLLLKGPGGYERATAFRKAVNDDPAAVNAMQNYLAATLRRVAENKDTGILDPGRFSSWKSAYQETLRAFPGLMKKFADVAKASDTLKTFAPFRPDLAPSTIPEIFFHSGPSGFEGVQDLRRLIGDRQADAVLSDYAASRLRAYAENPDGTLNPTKVQTWQRQHADAMRAFPELGGKFSNAGKASQTIADVAKARKQAVDDWQAGAIGKVLKSDPDDVVNVIGSVFNKPDSAAQMKRLVNEAQRSGPDAVEGLRKGIVDYMKKRFVTTAEAATSGQDLMTSDAFQKFIRNNRSALGSAFDENHIENFEAIAKDLHRANRSIVSTKIPGGSDTGQNLAPVIKQAASEHSDSLLGKLWKAAVLGSEGGGPHGAAIGASAAVAQHIFSGLQSAGYRKVDDLVRDFLLDPEKAKLALQKFSPKETKTRGMNFVKRMNRVSAFAPAAAASFQ